MYYRKGIPKTADLNKRSVPQFRYGDHVSETELDIVVFYRYIQDE